MMQYEFEKSGIYTIIHITGNFDTAESTGRLDNDIAALVRDGQHHFVFNLARTTYLDSAGISVFIHCLCDVQENNGSIFMIADDNQVRRVLEMVGLSRLITTYGSMKEFLNARRITVS